MGVEVVGLARGQWAAASGRAERDGGPLSPQHRAEKSKTAAQAHEEGRAFLRRLHAQDPQIREDFLSGYGALVRFAMNSVLRQKGVRLDPTEAEELFHALLLSFFEGDCRRLKMYEGRGGASFATFVRVCATRQTLDFTRRRQRQPSFVSSSPDDEAPGVLESMIDDAAGPEENAGAREQVRQLQDLIASLPSREQVLIRLHFVEGQAIPVVARALGITDNAAHVLKSRLRTKLRERMGLDSDA